MVKNWIILGDAALENADWTLGVIDFTQSEIANWKNIALERIKAAKTERITQFAKEGGIIGISGLFYVKNKISQSDFDDFCNQVAELFEVELLQFELSSSRRREDNKIFIILSGIKNKILDNLSEFPTRDALDLYMMEDETTING
ncbi:MAG: hypothetical protein MR794_05230 [Bacteroidales bacterium]|nr:hypothetical protein [Bacteroidales bacterium]